MLGVKSLVIENLVLLCDLYCEATQQTRASVSKAIHGRGGQIDDLAAGRRDLATRTAEAALQWFSDHWPDDAEWPDHIVRPAGSADGAHATGPNAPDPSSGGPAMEAAE